MMTAQKDCQNKLNKNPKKNRWLANYGIFLVSFSSLMLPSFLIPLSPNFVQGKLRLSPSMVLAQESNTNVEKQILKVGVFAIRGKDKAIAEWQPHMEYFARTISNYDFELVPLGLDEIEPAVENKQVDFVISNPGMYVNLEAKYGVNRIASLKNSRLGQPSTQFGAVIFTRADREDITRMKHFKGKTFMGVKENAFGGWQMAWDVFLDKEIDPYKQFKDLSFAGSHDNVVMAVLNGEADGGTVRTDTLERMAKAGKIKLEDFKIINQQEDPSGEFPFVHSTPLYPEWAFSATKGLDLEIEEELAQALLGMPSSGSAAIAAKIYGWTVPLSYRSVHELFIDLKIAPYEDLGGFTAAQLLQRLAILAVAGVIAIASLTIYFQRKGIVEQRKSEKALNKLNKSLETSAKEQRLQKEEQQKAKEELEQAIYVLIDEVADAADGDLTVRANLDSLELSTVADLFNAIIDNLEEIALEARQSTGQVGSALAKNQTAIKALAEQAITEAQETRKTLISVEEMSESIQSVAQSASQAEEIFDDTYQTVLNSTNDMDLTVNSILNLRNTVGDTAKKMKRLGESSQKISQAVSFIEEIALKTNILAINATVEAGRAGEYGEGFSIVAEQVATLAEQSAKATKEIGDIVAAIQAETQEVNFAMESGTAQVVETTRLVESTKESLSRVLTKSQEINQLMSSISQTTVSQANTSENVTNLMQKIAKLSEITSQSSEEVAQSIGETAEVAKRLESTVAQFKVAG